MISPECAPELVRFEMTVISVILVGPVFGTTARATTSSGAQTGSAPQAASISGSIRASSSRRTVNR